MRRTTPLACANVAFAVPAALAGFWSSALLSLLAALALASRRPFGRRVLWLVGVVQLGAGLAIVGFAWLFASMLHAVHGPLTPRLAGLFAVFHGLVVPWLVVVPAASLRAAGVRRGHLRRVFTAVALAIAIGSVVVHEVLVLRPADGVVQRHWKGASLVEERIVARGAFHPALLPFGLVPGRDGVEAVLDGRTVYATVDDLLAAQAYGRARSPLEAQLGLGLDFDAVLRVLADQLHVGPARVAENAAFRRVRFERPPRRPAAEDVTPALVTEAMAAAARHLARNLEQSGRFRYLVEGTTNRDLPGYNWPRHAGTTWFLAQAGARLHDDELRAAARRAAGGLRVHATQRCGTRRCIGDQPLIEVGSSALAVIALTEIVRDGGDPSFRTDLAELTDFLRSQARPDGELRHRFDRATGAPVDVQFPYFTGEAALALARAHRVLGDPRDLAASRAALAHLTTEAWPFFGRRYWWAEEHWTCQAVAELWDRAPDREALAWCADWSAHQRWLQVGPDEAAVDAEGAFEFDALSVPRSTPVASRAEAVGAVASVYRREPGHAAELARRGDQLRRAMAFVLRQQLRPGPTHLLGDPVSAHGAFPASAVDLELRIDFAQHAGSFMIRWLELQELR